MGSHSPGWAGRRSTRLGSKQTGHKPFFDWVTGVLTTQNDFIHKVVTDRRDHAVKDWKEWMHGDHTAQQYVWLRKDLVPPILSLWPWSILVDPSAVGAQFQKDASVDE